MSKYLYEIYFKGRNEPSVAVSETLIDVVDYRYSYVKVTNKETGAITDLLTEDDLLGWLEARERDIWKGLSSKQHRVEAEGNGGVDAPNATTISELIAIHADKEAAPEASPRLERIEKAVSPSHYKEYVAELQWIDAMSQIPSLRKPERFIAAVEMQIRKYMDRNGQKDDILQEWKKARFYMNYIVAYIANDCKFIPAEEIQRRMAEW